MSPTSSHRNSIKEIPKFLYYVLSGFVLLNTIINLFFFDLKRSLFVLIISLLIVIFYFLYYVITTKIFYETDQKYHYRFEKQRPYAFFGLGFTIGIIVGYIISMLIVPTNREFIKFAFSGTPTYTPISSPTSTITPTSTQTITLIPIDTITPAPTIVPTTLTPTLIPTLTPTNTLIPLTSTPTPNVILFEEFFNNENNWDLYNIRDLLLLLVSNISGGVYEHQLRCKPNENCYTITEIPYVSLKNFILEFEVTVQELSDASYLKIIVNYLMLDNRNYYTLDIRSEDEVRFTSTIDGRKYYLTEYLSDRNIRLIPGRINRFKLIFENGVHTFKANDEFVKSIDDGNILDEGKIQIGVEALFDSNAKVEFDNIQIIETQD